MRGEISLDVSPADRRRLEALIGDRNTAQKHIWRAEIVLLSADGLGTVAIMRRTGKSKTCVWRWQSSVRGGRLRRSPARQDAAAAHRAARGRSRGRVVALTLTDPPTEATHWTATMMAKATGISVSSVQRIGAPLGSSRTGFGSSSSRTIRSSSRNCGRGRISSTRRRMPSCSRWTKEARCRRSTGRSRGCPEEGPRRHDDPRLQAKRHDDAIRRAERPGRNRHRPQHGPRSPSGVHPLPQCHRNRSPHGKHVHAILDNYAAHEHPKVRQWLDRHPRWTFHSCRHPPPGSTPSKASSPSSKRRLKPGVFRFMVDLQAAVDRFVREHNTEPKPFVWTADPDHIIAAVKRGHQTLNSIH